MVRRRPWETYCIYIYKFRNPQLPFAIYVSMHPITYILIIFTYTFVFFKAYSTSTYLTIITSIYKQADKTKQKTKNNKLWILLCISFFLSFFLSLIKLTLKLIMTTEYQRMCDLTNDYLVFMGRKIMQQTQNKIVYLELNKLAKF